jgi:hypothetical protein
MCHLHNTTNLIVAALTARVPAYAPHSGFQLGAPLVTRAGKIYTKEEEFDLAELLPFPPQRILEGSRDV